MPRFSSDQPNPRELASQAATAARWHDVVTASSKLLHDTPLLEADRSALGWSGELLDRLASTDVVFSVSSAHQLADTGQSLAMLSRAAQGAHGSDPEFLRRLREEVDRALRGELDADSREAIGFLRDLFATTAQVGLRALVEAQGAEDPWARGSSR